MNQEENYKAAEKLFRMHPEQPVIVYYDEDYKEWSFCKESAWDRMVDNGVVEENWFYCMIT